MEPVARILLTGVPGWFTARFLDRFTTAYQKRFKIRCLVLPNQNLAPLIPYGDSIEIVAGDIGRPESLLSAVQGADIVVHAAGLLHVRRIAEFYQINRDGTRNLLQASARANVKRFIFISTNAAQGFAPDGNTRLKEDGACHPRSHYGISKYQAELLVRESHESKILETVILRPGMFYGPPVPQRHIDIFQKIQSGRFPVLGHGRYMRSLTYIDHLVQGVELALEHPRANGQIYYIADRNPYSLIDILEAMASALQVPLRVWRLPEFLAECACFMDWQLSKMGLYSMPLHLAGESTRHLPCDIRKAETELGYRPTMEIKEGYARAVQWCRQKGSIA